MNQKSPVDHLFDPDLPLLPALAATQRKTAAYPTPLWSALPTDWPRIGGRELSLFGNAEQLPSLPGYDPVACRAIYVAACEGARELAFRIGIPLYKIGCCAPDRVDSRMLEHNCAEYGSRYLSGNELRHEPGWNAWFSSIIQFGNILPANGPVRREGRLLIVGLPPGLSGAEFDRQFDLHIRQGSIDLWSLTGEGRNHCAARGVNPELLRRFTRYPGGSDMRLSPAYELVAFNPRWASHAEALVRLVHHIILKHLCPETAPQRRHPALTRHHSQLSASTFLPDLSAH